MTAPRNNVEYFARLTRIFSYDFGVLIGRKLAPCGRTGVCDSQRRLDGKTAIVTGGNTGMGLATAEDLWNRGADVVITSRDPSKGEAALKELRSRSEEASPASGGEEAARGSLRVAILDLASLESVRRTAHHLMTTLERIDILINNAGVMMPPFEKTEDGFELQFGTNHLGHFLFTLLLLPKILECAPSRIVIVSSLGHRFYNNLDLEIMNDPKRYYPLHAYGRSKAANVMFGRELAKRLEGTGVKVYSLNPGYVSTKLYRHSDEGMFPGFLWITEKIFFRTVFKSPWEGAQTIIHCAICESVEEETGYYYEDCRRTEVSKTCLDDKICLDLWESSLAWVGLGPGYDIFGSQARLTGTPGDKSQIPPGTTHIE